MKKIAFVLAICVCAFLFFFLRTQSGHSIGSTDAFWAHDDIEGFKIDPQTKLREVAVTMVQQPQFYSGATPLKYTTYIEDFIPSEVSAGMPGGIVVLEKFPGFENLYVYGDSLEDKLRGIPVGAVTMSESSEMLAQAKVVKRAPGRIEIEEQHLEGCDEGKCSLTFKATSSIDESGEKRTEVNTAGHKTRDYYFLWPMGMR